MKSVHQNVQHTGCILNVPYDHSYSRGRLNKVPADKRGGSRLEKERLPFIISYQLSSSFKNALIIIRT
jgi:hypothetical protein